MNVNLSKRYQFKFLILFVRSIVKSLAFVPGTNQYRAMRSKFFARGNNGSL